MNKWYAVGLLALTVSGPSMSSEEDKVWSGKGQLGFSMASGNTESENLNGSLNLKRETEKWVIEWEVQAHYASDDEEVTADRYTFRGKTGYKWDDRNHFFYSSRYENDNFSGYDYTISSSLGWGHKFFDDEKSKLLTELAIGYKTQAIDVDRTEESGAVVIGKMDYMRQLTETTKFEDVLLVEAGEDNTFIQNDAGFAFKVNGRMSVKLNYQYRHNTDPPAGKESTDELISANLVYDF